MTKDNTIGFRTLLNKVSKVAVKPFVYPIHDESGCLRTENAPFKNYIQPVFSTISHLGEEHSFEEARVILISAVGATGKSTLAKELSYRLKCPIVDLGLAEVIGGSSLTGLIVKKLDIEGSHPFMKDLSGGSATMIIDGLDEGFQKTKTQGYYDFLDDVIGMTSKAGKSFILLGRTNAIGLAALHFETHGVATVTYQIEPFYIDQAHQFIDASLKEESGIDVYSTPYKNLKKYIIESIGGFFKDRQDVKSSQYERFIGYAPVLLSIAEFLKKNKDNFQKVLSDFQKDQLKGTSLIIGIVEGILRRDKEMKIQPQLIEEKIKGRDIHFQNKARKLAYTFDEQCARVLYRCLRKPYNHSITGDERFDFEYSQGIERWIDEHPFLVENKINNSVFEGYILARLISNKLYRNAVDEYLSRTTGMSYMFFSIYLELHKDDINMDLSIVSYLYNSLKALDNSKKYYSLDLIYDEEDADEMTDEERDCKLLFSGNEDSELQKYEFNVRISKSARLPLYNNIGDVYIDAPINVDICSKRILLSAPGYINCKNVDILTDEIVLSRRNIENLFTIEAECVNLIIDKEYPNILADDDSKKYFAIICDNTLHYPFSDYQSSLAQKCQKLTSFQRGLYQKMRRTLIMFRSHSKGEFAKVQSKINKRISSKPDGKLVVDALLAKGVIYPKDKMYFIDKDRLNEHLGLKFDSIRACVINEKVVNFLQEIKSN